jgi:tripartite-type tricarboxylate transporter receptor subunit TctC
MNLRTILASGLAALTMSAALPASADGIVRPLRIIVPFAPGGGTDIVGRFIAERLTSILGKPVIVENRPGGGATIGADFVAKAEPDGQTLLFGTSAELTIAPHLYPNVRYNAAADFRPIALVGMTPSILLAEKNFPGNSIKDIVKLAKDAPEKVVYASGGAGTAPHLAGELLSEVAQVKILHVPYKGSGPAQSDLLGGHVSLMFSTIAPSVPLVQNNKVKAIAVTSARRSSALPNVPTVAEQGYPGYDVSIWYALLAPVRTPPEIIATLRAATEKIMQEKAFVERMATMGVEVPPPDERGETLLISRIRTESDQWARLIKKANIRAQ